jgi:hypothetical protein
MTLNTWKFFRLPGRDYAWSPEKPNFSRELLVWLESMPPVVVGRRDKSQQQPIVFCFKSASKWCSGRCILSEDSDEYGRPTAEVTISQKIQVSDVPPKPSALEQIKNNLGAIRFDQTGYNLLHGELENIQRFDLSLYFGPSSISPKFLQKNFEITEITSTTNFPSQSFFETRPQASHEVKSVSIPTGENLAPLVHGDNSTPSVPLPSVAAFEDTGGSVVDKIFEGTRRIFSHSWHSSSQGGGESIVLIRKLRPEFKHQGYAELLLNGHLEKYLTEIQVQRLVQFLSALSE